MIDGTDMNQVALLAANMLVVLDEGDGEFDVDVMLRGAFIALGKTAEHERDSIAQQFERLRSLLQDWIDEYKKLFPGKPCPLPNPAEITMSKLAAGGIQSDNAATAVKTSRMLAEVVYSEARRELEAGFDENYDLDLSKLPKHLVKLIEAKGLDPEVVADMNDEQLAEVLNVILSTCQRHTYNLLIDVGAKAELEYLKLLLNESLDDFTEFERVTVDVSNLNRAAGKELDYRAEAAYAKGGAVIHYFEFLVTRYSKTVVLNTFRSMLGGRQDHALAAAFELWWNRPIAVEYLDWRSAQEPTRSKLRDAIAVNLRCIEIVGALMARAVLFDKLFEPIRFFSADDDLRAKEGWTTLNMSEVYERLKAVCDRAKVAH
jgi:hypothetical protein